MSKFILALSLFISTPAFAWSDGDTKREAVYLTLHTMDWLQTREIARNPARWYETNSILGEQPSIGRVNNYFALTGLAHILVSKALNPKYRKVFQYVTIGIEGGVVVHNYSIGIEVRF